MKESCIIINGHSEGLVSEETAVYMEINFMGKKIIHFTVCNLIGKVYCGCCATAAPSTTDLCDSVH